ncbi:MAG: nucleotide exchange factor GrpE [Sedimentisphaerales bacterium]|nr:nucleotide exchange factor GrpE [Sedimentisphaerales bacterium]
MSSKKGKKKGNEKYRNQQQSARDDVANDVTGEFADEVVDNVADEITGEVAASDGFPEQPANSKVIFPTAKSPEQELEELKGRFQRLAADYQNYQKRSHKQIDQARQFARDDLARSLLVVLDNFEHTLEKGREIESVQALLEGIRIVYDHFVDILTGQGLKRITVEKGMAFDPNLHEALLHEPSDEYAANTIIRELSPGYAINDRTLRPAKVSVAKAVQPEPQQPEQNWENGQVEQTE